jgi:hypothetical protein
MSDSAVAGALLVRRPVIDRDRFATLALAGPAVVVLGLLFVVPLSALLALSLWAAAAYPSPPTRSYSARPTTWA